MLIQSHYNQQGIFERIVRSRDGQLVRVFFEVYEIGGEFKGRILRAEPILALAGESSKSECAHIFALCAPTKIVSPYHWTVEKKITSPFSIRDFLTSIKIRAPAY
ncbi:MAG: hypothetical protein WCO48_02925 [Candidatus Taylorbacteria bacterium]